MSATVENVNKIDDFFDLNSIVGSEKEDTLISEVVGLELPLTINYFNDDKEQRAFVNACKSMLRRSPEYKAWVSYLKETLGLYKCKFTGEINYQTSVDIHHHPISVGCIVNAVVNKFIETDTSFTSFDIITEVCKLHYNNMIGYVPLVSSLHEKFHNGYLLIPIEFVSGNYKQFLDTYSSYIEDDDLDTINSRLSVNINNCESNINWKKDTYEVEENYAISTKT